MNSILIAMFVFVCGLVVLLMYQSSRIMQMQEDLKEQLDAIHKCTLDSLGVQLKHQEKIGNQIERDIDILHAFLNEDTDTILKAIGSNNSDIDMISSYLEIMKNTILDMNDKMNKPVYGGEVSDTEEVDLMPEHWTIATPRYTDYLSCESNIISTDENM